MDKFGIFITEFTKTVAILLVLLLGVMTLYFSMYNSLINGEIALMLADSDLVGVCDLEFGSFELYGMFFYLEMMMYVASFLIISKGILNVRNKFKELAKK